jgi:hypothetical protein
VALATSTAWLLASAGKQSRSQYGLGWRLLTAKTRVITARKTPASSAVGHPGGFQTQLNSTLDVRLARNFHLREGTVSGYLDVFSILNLNRNAREADLTSPAFLLRVPLAVETPRTVRLGMSWNF